MKDEYEEHAKREKDGLKTGPADLPADARRRRVA
jgi:hypothetical protein